MPRAGTTCGLALGHHGRHLTPEAVERMLKRGVAYHTRNRVKRHARINRYKLDKGCIDCGYADDPVALDFDHRDPGLKIMNVAAMITYSWARIVAELDKCDVRCSNCHRIRTQGRRKPAATDDDGPHD